MPIEIEGPLDGPEAIKIDGENLDSDDGDVWYLPKGLCGTLKTADLPEGIEFLLCKRAAEVIELDSAPITIRREGARVLARVDETGTRKYWDGAVGFKLFMETRRQLVEERERELKDVKFEAFEDDGAWISFVWSMWLEAENLADLVRLSEQVVSEIDGAADIALGSPVPAPSPQQREEEFTMQTVIPLLRLLGFQNVKYNHGTAEFGKDVLFARFTELGDVEHWGAQIKIGDISGGANSQVDEILGQLDDAFSMPFFDVYTRASCRLSKVAIIISGAFTNNATMKICEKIQNYSARNNVVFIDGERIRSLLARFRRT